jgi:hypothetical protein
VGASYSRCVGAATTVTAVFRSCRLGLSMVIHCVSSTGSPIYDGDVVALPDYRSTIVISLFLSNSRIRYLGRQRGTKKKRGHEGCAATPRLAIVLYSRRTGVAATVTAVFRGSRLGLGMIIPCVSYAHSPICDGDAVALPDYRSTIVISLFLSNSRIRYLRQRRGTRKKRGHGGCAAASRLAIILYSHTRPCCGDGYCRVPRLSTRLGPGHSLRELHRQPNL